MTENENYQDYSPTRDQQASRTRIFAKMNRFRALIASKWWIPVLALLLGMAVQGIIWFVEKPQYTSHGRMIVNVRLTIPEGSVYTEEFSNFLGTQSALMQSGLVVNRAHAKVMAYQTNTEPELVDLKVSVLPKTTIFVLQATGGKEDYTRAFLQACMDEYVNLKKEMRNQTSDTTLAGLTEEILRLQRELKKADGDMVAFQSSNSVVLLQEQGNTAANYLGALNQKLAGLKSEYELLQSLSLEQNLERKQQNSSLPSAGELLGNNAAGATPDPGKLDYFRAKQQISLLKGEQADMAQFLKPKHPRMVALSDEIERRERLLEIFRQQSGEQLESLKSSLKLQIARLEQDVKEWDRRSLEVSQKNAEYQRLKSESQRVQALYDRLLGMMQTLDVNKDISPESVTIMEKASPALPEKAMLWTKLLIGALIGLVLSVALLLLLDRMDDRLSSLIELQDIFDENILAQIPREKTALNRLGEPLVSRENAPHAFLEAYRNLRSSLLFMNGMDEQKPKTLLVTSSVPSEGKSVTAANFAAILAISGSKVLLIDADMRKGVAHSEFGIVAEPGLSEVLSRNLPYNEAIQATSIPNLSVLPRGSVTQRGSELFLGAVTTTLLKRVAAEYEYVVIDTAPVMAADDVTSLAPHVDATLFVIRAEYTSARVSKAALELLYQRGVKMAGIIFNAVRPNSADYYYYKYQDYYAVYPADTSKQVAKK